MGGAIGKTCIENDTISKAAKTTVFPPWAPLDCIINHLRINDQQADCTRRNVMPPVTVRWGLFPLHTISPWLPHIAKVAEFCATTQPIDCSSRARLDEGSIGSGPGTALLTGASLILPSRANEIFIAWHLVQLRWRSRVILGTGSLKDQESAREYEIGAGCHSKWYNVNLF
jgi:hypothetical protein